MGSIDNGYGGITLIVFSSPTFIPVISFSKPGIMRPAPNSSSKSFASPPSKTLPSTRPVKSNVSLSPDLVLRLFYFFYSFGLAEPTSKKSADWGNDLEFYAWQECSFTMYNLCFLGGLPIYCLKKDPQIFAECIYLGKLFELFQLWK